MLDKHKLSISTGLVVLGLLIGWMPSAADNKLAASKLTFGVTEIQQTNFVAKLFTPKQAVNSPVVIVLGGSSGGMRTARGELLASHGIAALTLAYFRYGHLPDSLDHIPVESVTDAIDYLQTLPNIDASRIGIWGASRGSELAFLAATHDDRLKSVVATSPSLVAWHGQRGSTAWTLQGQPITALGFDRSSNQSIFQQASRALTHKDQVDKAQFKFNQINGPLLLISAEQDQIWPSLAMAETIKNQFKEQDFRFAVDHHAFPTGHTFNAEWMPEINRLIIAHFLKTLAVKE